LHPVAQSRHARAGLLLLAGAFACGSARTEPEIDDPSSAGTSAPSTTSSASTQAGASGSTSTTGITQAPSAGNAAPSAGRSANPAVGGNTAAGTGAGRAGQPASDSAGQGGSAGNDSAGASAAGSSAGTGGAAGSAANPPSKKFVGNITTSGQVRDDFVEYWDQITPENEGKWGSVEGTRNQMNWSGLDRAYAYAKMHGIPFKQHTFVWGSQQPNWLGGLSQADQKTEVEEWIRLYCERYPDTALIDVVNEPPPHTTPVYLEAIGGAGASGYDWIVQAFKWTKQYCPNAILMMNDYNNIEYGGDNERFLQIVERIRSAGAPIDALGAQAHDAHKLSASVVQGFIDKLSATGLPVYITEYDIDVADDAQQRKIMEEQFTLFWNDERVAGITLWGYVVGATWRPNTGLKTADGMERPALTWLREQLQR
jgi:endo-1,4-beta-xylanase